MGTLWSKYSKLSVLVWLLLVTPGTLLIRCAGVPEIPLLDVILQREPPITTSLSDAVTEVPFLNDFDPKEMSLLIFEPRDPDGTFQVVTGLFELTAKSYCLGVGKYAPSEGDGYLYAPLKGPWADIVGNILRRSLNQPEISQQDIQVLLWAILSRTKISDMPRDMQLTAAKLLTSEEIFELNGGALGLIPEELLQEALAKLPPEVRQVLEAEASLRRMLTEAMVSYDELERVAVLRGDPPPGKGSRQVPRGRWSYHPDGYFIRYFPSGYSQTRIQLYVPESFKIERDELGRITSVADGKGNRIETEYDDTVDPVSVAGDSGIRGYAFRLIRLVSPDPWRSGQIRLAEWNDIGWTLVNVPSGGGQVGPLSGRFSNLKERYDWAKAHKNQLDRLDEQFDPQGDINDIMDLGHYSLALRDAISGDGNDTVEWAADHIYLVKKAWQSSVCKREGGCQEFDKPIALGGAASPGDTGEQILTQAGDPQPLPPPDWWMPEDYGNWDELPKCRKRCVYECEKYREVDPDLWEKCIDSCPCGKPIASVNEPRGKS
ncbi:MAG TPA: hypothetical protein VMW90_07060 [Acidobacteriota bacterium]|nr:hypothetical protein [Acidobacteriota bacterium]